jgi:catechol 2,3-dioxygenase-like lactoylglutathione lyase family enzyme
MKVGYVVLYVNDAEACRKFWVDQVGMVEKRRSEGRWFAVTQ